MIFAFDRAENNLRKGKNAGDHHLLFSHKYFVRETTPSSMVASRILPNTVVRYCI